MVGGKQASLHPLLGSHPVGTVFWSKPVRGVPSLLLSRRPDAKREEENPDPRGIAGYEGSKLLEHSRERLELTSRVGFTAGPTHWDSTKKRNGRSGWKYLSRPSLAPAHPLSQAAGVGPCVEANSASWAPAPAAPGDGAPPHGPAREKGKGTVGADCSARTGRGRFRLAASVNRRPGPPRPSGTAPGCGRNRPAGSRHACTGRPDRDRSRPAASGSSSHRPGRPP